ncbi:UNVERIFIED_CONTAM: hypothetical protein K2H54_063025 [Gekko kuhli]
MDKSSRVVRMIETPVPDPRPPRALNRPTVLQPRLEFYTPPSPPPAYEVTTQPLPIHHHDGVRMSLKWTLVLACLAFIGALYILYKMWPLFAALWDLLRYCIVCLRRCFTQAPLEEAPLED